MGWLRRWLGGACLALQRALLPLGTAEHSAPPHQLSSATETRFHGCVPSLRTLAPLAVVGRTRCLASGLRPLTRHSACLRRTSQGDA